LKIEILCEDKKFGAYQCKFGGDKMSYREFKKVVEKNRISEEALTIYFQVSKTTVHDWLENRQHIPKNVFDAIIEIDTLFEEGISKILLVALDLKARKAPQLLSIITYNNEDDFFEFQEAAETFKTVLMYTSFTDRIYKVLQGYGFNVIYIQFDRTSYSHWKEQNDLINDAQSVSTWAALEAKKLVEHEIENTYH
jgi:hypothetical protein